MCVDLKLYAKLKELALPKMIPLFVEDFEELKDRTVVPGPHGGTPYQEYCWSLASRTCNILLNQKGLPEILYIDSDIPVYTDIERVFKAVDGKSIGIIPHLHVQRGSPYGAYNVGIVYFRGDTAGKACLSFWVECVTNPTGPYRQTHGLCGDQKYLELFEEKFPGAVEVIVEKAAHIAPWNARLFSYEPFDMTSKMVVFNGTVTPLVFYHFSHFATAYDTDTYIGITGSYDPNILRIPAIKALYDDYYQRCKKAHVRYST
jgi:hypothetical protein